MKKNGTTPVMESVRIRDGLYLVAMAVTPEAPASGPQAPGPRSDGTNHIWIIDRSGSMSGTLSQVCDDASGRLEQLESGDTLTLGWFSSEGGDWRFAIKGKQVNTEKDRAALRAVIDTMRTTRGTTCFSEILSDLSQTVGELMAFSPNFALMLLTDGYPVVSNHQKEIAAINAAIAAVRGQIASTLLVGYGNYYNRELMASMAEKFGGTLIHASGLAEYRASFTVFVDDVKETGRKATVSVPFANSALGGIFMVSGKQVTLLDYDASGNASVPCPKRGTAILYGLSPSLQGRESAFAPDNEKDPLTRGAYAAAVALLQKNRADLAMEVLGALGDVAATTAVSNAFTPDDFGKAESRLTLAVTRKADRFTAGRKVGCLPARDAFCVLDAIRVLQEDDARFLPRHPAFQYKRIGAPQVPKAGYPKFQASDGVSCPVGELTWHKTQLNLSVLAFIPGLIALGPEGLQAGLGTHFSTFQWKNYTLVKDGNLNVSVLPVLCSKDAYEKLANEGAVLDAYAPGEAVRVNLAALPVMNRAMADGKTQATALCRSIIEEQKLMAGQKVFKHYLGKLRPEDKPPALDLSPEQWAVLETKGVTKGGFKPPSDSVPVGDFYMAKELDIKVAGLSSLPKVEEVEAKMQIIAAEQEAALRPDPAEEKTKGKKKAKKPTELTVSQKLLAEHIEWFRSLKGDDEEKITELDYALASTKKALARVRQDIQSTKFAVLMANRSFDEFTTRDENELDVDDYHFTFARREIRIDL